MMIFEQHFVASRNNGDEGILPVAFAITNQENAGGVMWFLVYPRVVGSVIYTLIVPF